MTQLLSIILLVLGVLLVSSRKQGKKAVPSRVRDTSIIEEQPSQSRQHLFPALEDVPTKAARGRAWVVVASHSKYKKASDYILDQLSKQIGLHRVILVVNSSEQNRVIGSLDSQKPGSGPIVIERTQNIYEYSSYQAPHLLNAPMDDVFLMIHDTCTIGPKFSEKFENLARKVMERETDIHWLSVNGQFNISFINRRASDHAYKVLHNMETLSKKHGIAIENNRVPDSNKRWQPLTHTSSRHVANWIPNQFMPYSDQERMRSYFGELDLNKFVKWSDEEKIIHPNTI